MIYHKADLHGGKIMGYYQQQTQNLIGGIAQGTLMAKIAGISLKDIIKAKREQIERAKIRQQDIEAYRQQKPDVSFEEFAESRAETRRQELEDADPIKQLEVQVKGEREEKAQEVAEEAALKQVNEQKQMKKNAEEKLQEILDKSAAQEKLNKLLKGGK